MRGGRPCGVTASVVSAILHQRLRALGRSVRIGGWMVRILVHTGKGGVGKTTVAAATALRCAERGQRTIVLSTDAAHSLGDAFDTRLGPEPSEIAANLWAQEVNALHEMERNWGRVQRYLTDLLAWQGFE